MDLSGLVATIREGPEYEALSAETEVPERWVTGLSGSQKSLYVAAMAGSDRIFPSLVVTHSPDQADRWYRDLASLLSPDEVLLFPPLEIHPHEEIIADMDAEELDWTQTQLLILLNPEVVELEDFREVREGCLSLPGYITYIERAHNITTHADTLDGHSVSIEAGGLLAQAIQHEVEHLDGVLILHRMTEADKIKNRGAVEELKRKYKPQT